MTTSKISFDSKKMGGSRVTLFTNKHNSTDMSYLSRTVAKPLTKCLQELIEVRPMDPIEWIGHWLYKFRDSELYFSEKQAFLDSLQRTQNELELKRQQTEQRKACMKSKLGELKSFVGEAGIGGKSMSDLFARWKVLSDDALDDDDDVDIFGKKKKLSKRSNVTGADGMGSSKDKDGQADWRLSCQWGLICDHPVLGVMEPRPPLVYPETPEWWERQGYVEESLYDHEIYSRPNNDVIEGWDDVEHMTTRDFVTEGPWLSEGALRNAEPSLRDLYIKSKENEKARRPATYTQAKGECDTDIAELP